MLSSLLLSRPTKRDSYPRTLAGDAPPTCVGVDAAGQVEVEARGGTVGVNAELVEVVYTLTAGEGHDRSVVGVTLPLVYHVSAGTQAG